MRAYLRPLLLLWLVWHLFVMSVDLSKHVGRGMAPSVVKDALQAWSELREYTSPYQWRIGVHQNWSMFIPNPRLNTTWLEVRGVKRNGGDEVAVPLVVGEPDPEGILWGYARAGKHERNAAAAHRKRLRMAYTRYYCRVSKEAGEPFSAVKFSSVSYRTPPPELRGTLPRSEWPRTRRDLGAWNCRK